MLDKGLTTNILRFTYISIVPRHVGSRYSSQHCLHSLPRPAFKIKVSFTCYEDAMLFMINNLDKDREKLFEYFKADFKDLF